MVSAVTCAATIRHGHYILGRPAVDGQYINLGADLGAMGAAF